MTPEDLAAAVAYINEQRLSEPRELHRRTTTLEEHMATVAEQVVDITARLAKVDADLTRRDEAQAALAAKVAELEARLAEVVPEEELAALLEPVKSAVAALDDRTPEPETV